jgi:hypothetical protein
LTLFLQQTLRNTLLFWFKPLTFSRYLREVAGDTDLKSSLLRLHGRRGLWQNRALLRLLAQLGLGALFMLLVGAVVAEWFNTTFLTDRIYDWGRVLRTVAVGVAVGVAGGVAFGVAVGVAFGSTLIGLHIYPLWAMWTLAQWLRARNDPRYAARAFAHSALQFDELIQLPLPLFDRLALACTRVIPPALRDSILRQVAASVGQGWAARRVILELALDDANAARELAGLAASANAFGDLIATAQASRLFGKQTEVLALLEDFARVAATLSQAPNAHNANTAREVLRRSANDLDRLAKQAVLLKQPRFEPVAMHWQRLIRTYEAEILSGEVARSRLRPSYYAGTALNEKAAIFRGRGDVFELVQEVCANPERAETLRMVGQPRMGKSSVLMQLPAQLPDMQVFYIDCQRAFVTQSTAGYVNALTSALVDWERRQPGGLRLQALPLDELQTEPLLKLNRWLDEVSQRARGRRVLLCFDEFEKILQKVESGVISAEMLDQLRGLSQAKGWQVLFSGMYTLDDLALRYAEHFKNARRIKVGYLDETATRDLIEHPEPDYPLIYDRAAVDEIVRLTHCQPFLVQAMCAELVIHLNKHNRKHAHADDIPHLLGPLYESYPDYFASLKQGLSAAENEVLSAVAHGQFVSRNTTLRRLHQRDYIAPAPNNTWRFQVPLLQHWWQANT